MNVDTDEFLKSLKSLQVSPCECSAKNPDSDYPNQHTKACPRFQTMHCWCPSATGPGQPHQSDCFQYKQPIIHAIGSASNGSSHDWDLIGGLTKEAVHKVYAKFTSGPFFGHGLQYQVKLPMKSATPGKQPEPEFISDVVDPGKWTFGEMAAKIIADAVAAAESEIGQGALPATEIQPEPPGPFQLTQKEKQSLAYVQAHAMQLQVQAMQLAHNQAQLWADKQKPESFVHFVHDEIVINELTGAAESAPPGPPASNEDPSAGPDPP
jgi:hypothetical protein